MTEAVVPFEIPETINAQHKTEDSSSVHSGRQHLQWLVEIQSFVNPNSFLFIYRKDNNIIELEWFEKDQKVWILLGHGMAIKAHC